MIKAQRVFAEEEAQDSASSSSSFGGGGGERSGSPSLPPPPPLPVSAGVVSQSIFVLVLRFFGNAMIYLKG